MSDADIGHGAEFQRHDGAEYVKIANVFGLSGPNMTRDAVEITTLDSPNKYREFIGGLRDGGEVTFTLNYTRANYLIFKGDYENDDPVQYQVVLPDTNNTTLTFTGLVTDLPLDIPEGDRITSNITIKVAGEVTDDST